MDASQQDKQGIELIPIHQEALSNQETKAGEIHVSTPEQAIKHAQALVRRYVPPGRLLSEELIAERRLEE